MKPSIALQTHRIAVRRIVEVHRARNARVFGSVATGDDSEDSDLDILVDPTPGTTLFDIGAIRGELGQLLGVPVDVLTPNALPARIRGAVLAEAVPVWAGEVSASPTTWIMSSKPSTASTAIPRTWRTRPSSTATWHRTR